MIKLKFSQLHLDFTVIPPWKMDLKQVIKPSGREISGECT